MTQWRANVRMRLRACAGWFCTWSKALFCLTRPSIIKKAAPWQKLSSDISCHNILAPLFSIHVEFISTIFYNMQLHVYGISNASGEIRIILVWMVVDFMCRYYAPIYCSEATVRTFLMKKCVWNWENPVWNLGKQDWQRISPVHWNSSCASNVDYRVHTHRTPTPTQLAPLHRLNRNTIFREIRLGSLIPRK